jgi:hypothetical protein
MKKLDLERILMDPEALKKLTDRANMFKQREGEFGRTQGQPASIIRDNVPLPHQIRPTPDEIRANDFDHVVKKNLLANIGRFIPEIEKEEPKKILSILTEKCRKDPSEANQFLVEDAINRLTSVGELDKDAEKLIDKAIEMLSSAKKPEEQKDSIWSMLYEHSDRRGRRFFVYHGPGWVYRLVRASSLRDVHLHDKISSLYVEASSGEVGGEVILFQHDRYFGRYARFTTTPGAPTVRNNINYVGDFINDKTSSILVVRRFNNELPPTALGSLVSRDDIENFVNSIERISMRGNPIFTWDMWPEGGDDHPNDPSRRFIEIKIPVRVDVPHWFDYDAEIRYWIYLYVDSSGILRGYVAHYGAWVEGGIISGKISDRIMDALPGTIGTVESFLSDALTMVNTLGPFERQYFLPGTASSTGNTDDDISIVLVRR